MSKLIYRPTSRRTLLKAGAGTAGLLMAGAAPIPAHRWNGSPTSFWIAPARSFNAASTERCFASKTVIAFPAPVSGNRYNGLN